jgi:protein-S-isoprenylcysteine O-methyltransferase Ste14
VEPRHHNRRTAGVIPPPIVLLAALGGGIAIHRIAPEPILAERAIGDLVGAILIALGIGLSAWMVVHFRRSGTPVSPLRPTRGLVVTGPYRFTRNPDYIGQALIATGAAFLLNSLWILIALVAALLVIRYFVIAREERYLRSLFGDDYARYCDRVRRWL